MVINAAALETVYAISNVDEMISPSMVVFKDVMLRNLDTMVRIAGDASRLRPHCKTHKMAAVTEIELSKGVVKHKAATFAECEMLARAGVKDILLSYNLVGPNIRRAVAFKQAFPNVKFMATADHIPAIKQLGEAMTAAGLKMEMLLDINPGFNRTGISPTNPHAMDTYRALVETPGVSAGGMHIYDANNYQFDLEERTAGVHATWNAAKGLQEKFETRGWPVPRIVCGGTGSFPVYAAINDPVLELSPGTTVFHDYSYAEMFPDMHFEPAVAVLTRVISHPLPDRVTFDAGHKSITPDLPMGNRLAFPDMPDAKQVLQNEEHLGIETSHAAKLSPGDHRLAFPRHVCTTTSLHDWAYVVDGGHMVGRWTISSRTREITI